MSTKKRAQAQAKNSYRVCKYDRCTHPTVARSRYCSRHYEVARHYGKKPSKSSFYALRAAKRVKELNLISWTEYPDQVLPNNELGRNWAGYMMETMGLLPICRKAQWLDRHCPWVK
jgi:hypothetical protein